MICRGFLYLLRGMPTVYDSVLVSWCHVDGGSDTQKREAELSSRQEGIFDTTGQCASNFR